MTPTEFLIARIDEEERRVHEWQAAMDSDEEAAIGVPSWVILGHGLVIPRVALAECRFKRRVLELHESWPVLVETPDDVLKPWSFKDVASGDAALSVSRRIAWLTQLEYQARFGVEPPTAPMVDAMLELYEDHPDFDPAWRGEGGPS